MSSLPPPPPPSPSPAPRDPQAALGAGTPRMGQIPSGAAVRRFDKVPPRPTLHPRRVVGGIRLVARPPSATPGQAIEPVITPAPTSPPAPAKASSKNKPSGAETAPAPPEAAPANTEATDGAPVEGGWTWVAARWMRPVEEHAPGDQLAEGLEYARSGQTRGLEHKPGLVSARVQGRMPQAYKCAVRIPTFTPEQWEKVSQLMAGQARYAAALLAGELPTNIEDMFAPAGLNLFPADASDISTSCDCDIFTGRVRDYTATPTEPPKPSSRSSRAQSGTPWCKHICCVMFLIADGLARRPLSIFSMRGLAEGDLVERLRQARALQGMQRAGAAAAPVYTPHVPGLESQGTPLEDAVHTFYSATDPDALASLDLPIAPPEVSHPLLRRVGPSPFTGAKFPITGLLATCYDVISETVIRETQARD